MWLIFAFVGHILFYCINGKFDVRNNFGSDVVLEISSSFMSTEVNEILTNFDADHFSTINNKMHFKVPQEVQKELKKYDVEFKDVTENWISHFETNFENENFICSGSDCSTRNLQDFYSSYQSLDSLHNRARFLVSSASSKLNAKIGSLGLSYEGRDQLTVEIGKGEKPLVFYFCNIHAREWLPPMFCMYMAEMLLTGEASALSEAYDFTILISANPDGFVYSQTVNNLWRKTRRPNPGSSCIGTDPNRNYDFYHCGTGTSNNPCSDVFCGPTPFSEKITQNIRNYGLKHQNRIITLNDVHAKGQLWMYPYGSFSGQPEEPDLSKLDRCTTDVANAIKESGGNTWKYGPIHSTIYPAAGTSVDWFYEEIGVVYSFTAELRGSSFQPPASNIILSNQEVFAGMAASLVCIAKEEGIELSEVILPPIIEVEQEKPCDFLFC